MTNTDWATKDFYKTLGVSKDASQDEIKKAYRKLARANHPDSKPGDKAAEERFKAIAEAYDVIGDAEKRKEYDEHPRRCSPAAARSGRRRRPGRRSTSATSSAATSATSSAGMFGGGGRRTTRAHQRRARRGADVETETTISFTDAVEGVTVSLRLTRDAPCPDCRGTGARAGTMPRVCPECEGVGMRAASRRRRVHAERDLPGLRRPRPRRRRPVPDLPRLRPRLLQPHHLRPHPRRRQGRPADPAARQGRHRRVRRPGRRPLRHRHVAAHPLFGRKGDNLTLKVPDRLPRGGARRRGQGARRSAAPR